MYVDYIFMEQKMSVVDDLKKTVIDYIVKGRVSRLEKAFETSPDLVGHIKNYWKAHEKFVKGMESWCKKYPDSCKEKKLKR